MITYNGVMCIGRSLVLIGRREVLLDLHNLLFLRENE